MAYDVFVVSALEDRDMANLVVRRLRALKFKCWFDKKQTDNTFDQKDARNALNSQSMLVLWSKNAVKSDWVRAAASVGNSRPGMLVEIGLDDTIPYEPFSINKRHSLEGMTTRTTVDGFYEVVDELARRDGRRGLREWINYGKDDAAKKAAWLENHPSDPLAIAESKKKEREASAAAKDSSDETSSAAPAAAVPAKSAPETKSVSAEVSAEPAAASGEADEVKVIGSGYGQGVGKVPGTPGAPYIAGRKGPAGVATAPPPSATPSHAAPQSTDNEGIGRLMLAGIVLGILSLFLFSGILRTSPVAKFANYAGGGGGVVSSNSDGSVLIGGPGVQIADSCPAGYIASNSLAEVPTTNAKEDEEE